MRSFFTTWSKGRNAKYAYYFCRTKGCDNYGKSIKREQLEGDFEKLLRRIQPTHSLFTVAKLMLEDLWNHRVQSRKARSKSLER